MIEMHGTGVKIMYICLRTENRKYMGSRQSAILKYSLLTRTNGRIVLI